MSGGAGDGVRADVEVHTNSREVMRAFGFTQRFARSRSSDRDGATATSEYRATLSALLGAAVPEFCDWCAVDLDDSHGALTLFALRHEGCDVVDDEANARRCGPSLEATVPDRSAMVERACAEGATQLALITGTAGVAVVPLRINDRLFGAVTYVRAQKDVAFNDADVAALEDVTWVAASSIERALLVRDSRAAMRRTQKLASQLHQLIAASITVTGLQGEVNILKNLVASTRSVFDADVAVVSLERGASAPLQSVAHKGKGPVAGSPSDLFVIESSPSRNEPWFEDGWLIAPILERRGHPLGLLAVRRAVEVPFGDEDREVLTLLAQLAASALGAAELGRTVQSSETRLRTLIEAAPVGVVEVDFDGGVRWWNRAASSIFGWEEFDQTTSDTPPGFPDSMYEDLRDVWQQVQRGDDATGRDVGDVSVAGRTKILSVTAALLAMPQSPPQGILTLVDDVTNHRELKAELRHAHTMEVRGQVASRIAHDFNNLLTLISGYSEILAHDLRDDERATEMIKDIQATASRASLLTGQLQTIGRTKATEPIIFDPVGIIESNAEVLERILGATIELDWAIHGRPGNVRTDPDQFEQMILNISINARDAMPDGGVLDIDVDESVLDDHDARAAGVAPGTYVRIVITDNGLGMDEATREKCFDPLFTTKGPFKGTGMGLAAARRLVEESHGAIRCISTPGVGTSFEVLLPRVDGDAATVVDNTAVERPRGSATVLLVDDDEGLRRMMNQVLTRNGYEVLVASSGEEALDVVRERASTIDLLVSDVVMGELSGRDLAVTLQSSDPSLRVLMVSGTARESILEGLAPGTGTFLAKPFKPSELIDRVHELLARRG